MWTCPRCGRAFANRNQTHSCRALVDLDEHFSSSAPVVRDTLDRIVDEVSALGPVIILSEKTRIALQTRMSFAAFVPRRDWLDGHVVLSERLYSPRFTRVETYSPRNVLHAFRLREVAEVDNEFRDWLKRSYRVGDQEHLES